MPYGYRRVDGFDHLHDVAMSNTTKDGGPAFPRPISETQPGMNYRRVPEQSGMSLRDYFAGLAMNGMISNSSVIIQDMDIPRNKEAWNVISKKAYLIADAMLKAREE